ncbi:transcriptional regulator Rrf2 family [Eubacterium sp. CAG:252]|nr:transcriptional regulator Rrf2 family [Eubacterium sp. CAG:252]
MVISSKGRYALRVMVYLAVNHSDDYIPLKEISKKEDLSQKYLETITRMLSKAHLIEAASGHGGGYRLTRNPADYSISEILNLTEGSLAPVSCLKDEQNMCERSSACYTLPIWEGLAKIINDYFDNMTLADVVRLATEADKPEENKADKEDKKPDSRKVKESN